MPDAMEADQDNALSRRGSFYVAEDSFLLSDYLHRQAEKAGNRFFSHTNSLLFLRSTLLLSELEQKELAENSDRCCFPELKSGPLGFSAAHKESSESFSARECSSHFISELEQEKGKSSSPHRILASCVSYVGSSECCQSAEAATRIEANSESLHNVLCLESRQAISLSIDDEEEEQQGEGADVEDHTVEEALTVGFGDTEALNLLVTAALQLDNDDGDQDRHRIAGMVPLKKSNGASAIHGNSPILKRKVIRRAKSAFPKQKSDYSLQKLERSEAATIAAKHAVETNLIEQVNRKGVVVRTKCRKLRDLSSDPSNALTAACTSLAKDPQKTQDEGEILAVGSFGDDKEEILAVENLQALPAKIPSSLSTEDTKIVLKEEENQEYFVNHRKLQVLSAKLSDACNAEHSKELQAKPESWTKLEYNQTSRFSRNCLASKGVSRACITGKETKKSSMERLRSQEEAACLGSPGLRLKILPIRQLSADLPSLQEVSKSESTEVTLEGRIATRKRKMLSSGEEAMAASELMLHSESLLQDIQAKDGDPVIRSKRGRSQVLPTKFSDSVLQPWKSSRKRCKKRF